MSQFRLPPQIVRLVLLTIGIVGSYLVARYFLTPQSFGAYDGGWYRGDALAELASHPPGYAGKKACEECHSDEADKLRKHEHKTLSCEGCHGPAQAHVDDPENEKNKPDKRNSVACLRCHEANPSRPKWLKQITLKDHYTGQKCTECHVPHMPLEVP
jgi:hypothetical protein